MLNNNEKGLERIMNTQMGGVLVVCSAHRVREASSQRTGTFCKTKAGMSMTAHIDMLLIFQPSELPHLGGAAGAPG